MKKLTRISEQFDLPINATEEQISDEIRYQLQALLVVLARDIAKEGLTFPLVLELEHETDKWDQRFKVTAREKK